jgi:hypothetical protein
MWLLTFGLLVFLLPGSWALRRAKRELHESDRITVQTFVAVFLAYVGYAVVTLFAAWKSSWPLPIPESVGLLTGGSLALVGATLYVAGRLEF